MRNFKSPHKTLSMQDFLQRVEIAAGIVDYFQNKPFHEYYYFPTAVTYERGRQIGAFMKSEGLRLNNVYDFAGAATSRAIEAGHKYTRMKLFV